MSRKTRIVIADDEPQVLRLVSRFLTDAGYECELASTAAASIDTVIRVKPDLLLSDIVLPDDRDLHFLSAIPKHVPVVLMTGRPSVETAVVAIRRGVVDYLTKPFRREQLLECIETALASVAEQRGPTGDLADPELSSVREILAAHDAKVLSESAGQDERLTKIRTQMIRGIRDGGASLASLASAMGTSPRTLQRQLQELGSSHSEVFDGVRYALARAYLGDERLSIGEVAYALGFTTPSAFHRAFKRWAGMTPGEFRTPAAD